MKKFLTILLALAIMMTASVGFVSAEEAAKEPVTITMLSLPANVSGTMEDTWWTDYLYDELAITVELLPGGGDDTKLAALMAADSLPDMVIFKDGTQIKNCADAGQLLALTDYADQLPNANKNMAQSMAYYADAYSSDGKCYAISNDVGARTSASRLNWSTAIRWDLYQEIGAPEIKTAWDYLDVLKQMQDIYPENEDGQKVYAITAWSDWDSYCMQNVTQLSMLSGVDTGDQLGNKLPFAEVDFDTMELSCIMDEVSAYIDGLKWYFTANQMGILDPDSMTQTWNTALEKGNSGRVLFGWWLWAVSGYNTPDRVNAEDPTGFATVLPTETKIPLFGSSVIGSGWAWGISSKSANVDRCLEYLDFMCNPDKTFVLYNGPQGETWDLNEEGKPYLTEKGLACIADGTMLLENGGTLGSGTSTINSTPVSNGTVSELYGATMAYSEWDTYENTLTNLQKEVAEATGYERAVDMLLANGTYTEMPLANSLIAPLSDEMQMLATQIGDVIKTQSWLAVFAADEAEFDQIVSDMRDMANELGLQELIEYNKTAWADAVALAANYQ